VADEIRFDWDEANVEHIARHNVTPQEVEQMFANGVQDAGFEHSEGEDRYSVIGHTNSLRVLLMVWTYRNGLVRPITAREVGKRMRENYFRSRG
jgi:hypothetical protein